MPKPLAWFVIAVLAAMFAWLIADRWREAGWFGLITDAAIMLAAALVGVAMLALWAFAEHTFKRLYRKLFVPPPWQRPRSVHEFRDHDGFAALAARLDPEIRPSPHSRITFHRDRITGQLWQQTEWDVGHSSARELTPADDAAAHSEPNQPLKANRSHPNAARPGQATRNR